MAADAWRARSAVFPLPGGGGVLGSGWPRFEQDERELGLLAAMAMDDEAAGMEPGMEWLIDLQYQAYCEGTTPEVILGAAKV